MMPAKRRIRWAWLVVLGPAITVVARAVEPVDALADFDAYVHAALAEWQTPGVAVAILKDGKVVLARGYGTRHAGEDSPPDEHTLFPISSVTKVFTATCLALLVEEGKLNWIDPVIKHLPEFQLYDPFLTKDVRIDDLVSHRVGLETADLLAYRGDYDRPEILRRLRFLQPVAPFRSRFGYHNHMVTTAGEVLERVSGQSWDDFLRRRLLGPLGMSTTLANPRELVGRENVSTQHVLSEGKLIDDPGSKRGPGSEAFQRLTDAVAPAGAIQSTAYDMAKFVQMYLDEGIVHGRPFLQPASVRTMFAPHSAVPIKATPQANVAYPQIFYGGGLGWQIRDYRGRKIIMHNGSSGAIVAMMPEEKIGIVVLANRGCSMEFMFMHDIFARLLGLSRPMTTRDWLVEAKEKPAQATAARNAKLEASRTRDTRPSLPLPHYTGTFECDLYGNLEISEQENSLRAQFGPNISGMLVHWQDDTFRAQLSFPPGEEWFVRFEVLGGQTDRLQVERISWPEPMPEFHRLRQ